MAPVSKKTGGAEVGTERGAEVGAEGGDTEIDWNQSRCRSSDMGIVLVLSAAAAVSPWEKRSITDCTVSPGRSRSTGSIEQPRARRKLAASWTAAKESTGPSAAEGARVRDRCVSN